MIEVRSSLINRDLLNKWTDAVMEDIRSRLPTNIVVNIDNDWLEDSVRWDVLYGDDPLEDIAEQYVKDIGVDGKPGYFLWSDPALR